MRRVGLVGAGFISRVHAEVLRSTPGVRLTAIIDPKEENARALARDFGPADIFTSVDAALATDAFDCAHVLVPPDLHAAVAQQLIASGKPLLVEKPLAETEDDCNKLIEQARSTGVTLGVNQNFVHHPAFRRLLIAVRSNELGPASHITCTYNVPLRQIAARQFGHWMFASARNLLLEQAVHPLSQLTMLAGQILDLQLLASEALQLPEGQTIYPAMDVLLRCEHAPASLRFAVGQEYPFWQISVICDDGVAIADMFANRFYTHKRSRWVEAVDGIVSGGQTAASMVQASLRHASDYSLSLLRLRPRSDAFYQSMLGSISAFHAALDAGTTPDLDGCFAANLVVVCERMAGRLETIPAAEKPSAPVAPAGGPPSPTPVIHAKSLPPGRHGAGIHSAQLAREPASTTHGISPPDLAILGGTGFIGTHLVRHCLDHGLRVTVMARSTRGLPDVFGDPRVRVLRGDIRQASSVEAAITGAPAVINLAHGGGGSSWDEVREAMVGGAEIVARACMAAGVKRLVHVGSIAGLYLGPQARPVTGATPPDPRSDHRADYARAKAICDRLLLEIHATAGLPLVILRPGVVVGEGGPIFHGGLGFFNNDQHCIGWNEGRNPLPFVLVEDVADAILRAAKTPGIEGRCYNLVGDVRPSAREYISLLGEALHRPLRFHPQSAVKLWAAELGKWGIKRAGGRRPPLPSLRDLLSRGMKAEFNCSDAKHDLAWSPVSDPAIFETRAVRVHTG